MRKNLRETCQKLIKDIPNIRIGIIAHGDYCDHSNYVIKIQDLTSDVQQLVDFAKNSPSTGGGDAPEVYILVYFPFRFLIVFPESISKKYLPRGIFFSHKFWFTYTYRRPFLFKI